MGPNLPAEAVIAALAASADETGLAALWLVGSFAEGTADRWSDIDLRGVTTDREVAVWPAMEEALLPFGCEVVKRRACTEQRPEGELVALFAKGFELDFHLLPQSELTAQYVGRYPVRVLLDQSCHVAELQAEAEGLSCSSTRSDVGACVSRAVYCWDQLHHGFVAYLRDEYDEALTRLVACHHELMHLVMRDRWELGPVPNLGGLRHLPLPERDMLSLIAPVRVHENMPNMVRGLASVLGQVTEALEREDETGRLAKWRRFVQSVLEEGLRRRLAEGE